LVTGPLCSIPRSTLRRLRAAIRRASSQVGSQVETRLGGGLQIQVCPSSWNSPLLQVDGLIMPRLVELCAPHLVHALVVGAAEGHGRAEPNVEIVQIFQSSY